MRGGSQRINLRTIKLAYNYSISHNIVHIKYSIKVKTWIYQIAIFDILINLKFILILYYYLNVSRYGNILIYCCISNSLSGTIY